MSRAQCTHVRFYRKLAQLSSGAYTAREGEENVSEHECESGVRQINANQKQRMWNNGIEKTQADVE